MPQVTTLNFFRFDGFADKFWAFRMMQFAHRHISAARGQSFYKLMGSGKLRGFDPRPDWSTYALLQVWNDEASAEEFFASAEIFGRYKRRATSFGTVFMRCIAAKGEWSGASPFDVSDEIDPSEQRVAVITRASIKPSKMRRFWSFVPRSEKPLDDCEGLLFTKGVGEAPLVRMATFSIWRDAESMKNFAYKSAGHLEAIRKTRELGWYSEELFARFQPFRFDGSPEFWLIAAEI